MPNDFVDPAQVPQRTLASGARMPAVGMGTFGSDHVTPQEVADAVRGALEVGYRHLDCAAVYGNEAEIGEILQKAFRDGLVKREELWITSKLWNDRHSPEDAKAAFAKTLADLQLDYVDLYLVHWPFPNFHPPGCSVDSRSPDAVPYIHENFMRTWQTLESFVDDGRARHIGTSNMTVPKLELVLRDARVKPAVNEMELHPHFQQPELFDFVRKNGIEPIGYCPIGSPNRPERDRTPEDTVDIEDPVIVEIAARHNLHPAVLCIKWAVQRGQTPIPFSTKRRNYLSNLACVTTPPLTAAEMEAITKIDRGCRLIKGQVFLWEGAQGWEDLWDVDGTITTR
jgi:diketogulonate reductase-like aldo/keto reductase